MGRINQYFFILFIEVLTIYPRAVLTTQKRGREDKLFT